jgi:predicted dienelactone hydrolase
MNISVRALYRAVAIPELAAPYNSATLKIYYPATYSASFEERNTGVVPVNKSSAPFPVVVMIPGINLSPEAYSWLAKVLAENGIITVTYSLIAEEMPGYISLTPGIDLTMLAPEHYGSGPSCIALPHIIKDLHALQQDGVLAGLLDLGAIVLGGHSAGGTMSLLNADPDWLPEVSACFAYAAHSGASMTLGWNEATILPLPSKVPTLIIGGSNDGVIAASAHRYGIVEGSPTGSLQRTYDEGIQSDRNDSYLFIVDGANHFTLAYPKDTSTGRPFIDHENTRPDAELRATIASLLTNFIGAHIQDKTECRVALQQTLTNVPTTITSCDCK